MLSKYAAARLSKLDPRGTVFSEYTALSNEYKSINLGQGFPTLPVAPFILEAAKKAVSSTCMGHQYSRSEGNMKLTNSLAKFYSPKVGRELNPATEIMTTIGASEAIYSSIQSIVNPGDEVMIICPFYDSYPASVLLAGGIPVCVSLTSQGPNSSDWKLDMEELSKKVSSKTKILIINNPNNPLGKVWSRNELESLAAFAENNDLIVIADEVYETLVFGDSKEKMIKFASLPGMFKRTITVGSMGKMFGVTGWKIGWVIAPPELTRASWLVHQFLPFCVVTPLQEAGGESLEIAMSTDYFEKTAKQYQELRDKLFATLEKAGLNPTKPDGGYFIIARIDSNDSIPPDQDISTFLTKQVGVTSIPMRAFYQAEDHEKVSKYIRFAFCKDSSMLDQASERLLNYFK